MRETFSNRVRLHKTASLLLVFLSLGLASSALIFGAGCASAPAAEAKRAEERKRDIGVRLSSISELALSDPSAAMDQAVSLLARLEEEGLSELSIAPEPAAPSAGALAREAFQAASTGLCVEPSPSGGILPSDARVTLRAADGSGRPLARFPLTARWLAGGESRVQRLFTNEEGFASIAPPSTGAFADAEVRLSVAPDFSSRLPSDPFLASFDASHAAEGRYLRLMDEGAWFSSREVTIPGGRFRVGALAQDARASSLEKPREASVQAFVMDAYPVTNALYAAYLAEAGEGAEVPEYWGNPDYEGPDRPVVGLSRAGAEGFAAWLSIKRGRRYRLPTEEEYERAARAGRDSIYPWGDQAPAEGRRANYLGNGAFEGPSPVGAYPGGTNAWGLADMVGNVWQWTASDSGAHPALAVVKGGSWMDGPADLRVSNRRFLSPSDRRVDVGFRLVREANDE